MFEILRVSILTLHLISPWTHSLFITQSTSITSYFIPLTTNYISSLTKTITFIFYFSFKTFHLNHFSLQLLTKTPLLPSPKALNFLHKTTQNIKLPLLNLHKIPSSILFWVQTSLQLNFSIDNFLKDASKKNQCRRIIQNETVSARNSNPYNIVFEDEEQAKRYSVLARCKITPSRYMCERTLTDLGLKYEVDRMFHVIGLLEFLHFEAQLLSG